MQLESQRRLVEKLREGDAHAWSLVVSANTPRLRRVARGVAPCAAAAEDALQESFLAAYLGIRHFDGRSALSTWLHSIVVHAALGHRRRLERRRETNLEPEEVAADSSREASATDARGIPFTGPETFALVRQALAPLSKPARVLFVLRHVEGYSSREVAQELRITDASVRQRLRRLRATVALQLRADPTSGLTSGSRAGSPRGSARRFA